MCYGSEVSVSFPPTENSNLSSFDASSLLSSFLFFSDFAMEIWTANLFFLDYLRGQPGTRSKEMNGFDHRLNKACVDFVSSPSLPSFPFPAFFSLMTLFR